MGKIYPARFQEGDPLSFVEVAVGIRDAHLLWVPGIHRGLANLAGCVGILCPPGAQL